MKTLLHAGAAVFLLVLDWLIGASRDRMDPVRAPMVHFVVKHPWITAAVLIGALGIGVTLIVVSGVVPIKASSGHWWITAKLLDFAKLRSVTTHSLGVEAPPLDDDWLVLRGAGHYSVGCYSCHGGPNGNLPPVMTAMTPPPPALTDERLARWTPEQLFSIVRHGIKFTGMPAWPVQGRDDEVWAVVAFLRRMPNLDEAAYERLGYGNSISAARDLPNAGVNPPIPVRDVCWRCHGVDGTGRGAGAFPSLAGQRSAYLEASLRAFRDRTRFSGTMGEVAAKLSDAAIREIAAYYERLPRRQAELARDPETITRGATIASRGIPERDIPACVECHGPTNPPRIPGYPALAGQHGRYLNLQLELLQGRRRGGSARVNLMHAVVDRLGPDDMKAVTLYYASLNAAPAAPTTQ